VYTNKVNTVKTVFVLLALLMLQPIAATSLSPTGINATCTYTVRKAVDGDNLVVDVRITTSNRLPSPQTLRVRVVGENGVVVVEVVKPIAKLYCSFRGSKLVLTVDNVQREYNIAVLDEQTIAIRPSVEKETTINIDVEGGSVVGYALSSIRLVDALLYGYPVNLRGKLLSIHCSNKHNMSVFQIFYKDGVRGWLDAHIQVKHNVLLYSYRGPPLPSIEDILDILKERCRGTVESTEDVRSGVRPGYVGVEEPLLPLPAGLAIFLDSVLSIPSSNAPSLVNKSGNFTSTIPELVKAVKQAYKRLLDIIKSLDNNTLFEQQASVLGEREIRTYAKDVGKTINTSSTHQTSIDIPLLLFPLALAVVAYMVWREHRI